MDKAKIMRLCKDEISEAWNSDVIEYDKAGHIVSLVQKIAAEISEPPKSNADLIRQMTDDEELLSAIGMSCYRCVYNRGKCSCEFNNGCYAGNLEWLRKEADNG